MLRRITALLLPLTLAGCIGPQLGASVSAGPYGTHFNPSISAGLEGGGTLTYTP